MNNICPYKIVEPAAPVVPLLPFSATANLQNIILNIHNPVLLRLLVCKVENETKNPGDCPYPDHRNIAATKIGCNSQDNLAHIYLRDEPINTTARSCIIAFIETMYLFDPKGLLNMFQSTVNWLDVSHERPYFFVIPYGKPQTSNTTGFTSKVINIELKKIYPEYPKGEDICIITPAEQKAPSLRITHTSKFCIKVS